MCWNAKYALLLLFSTIVTYAGGYVMDCFEHRGWPEKIIIKRKKYCVFMSFFLNLAVLFLFKYFDFAIVNINRILGALHMSLLQPRFDVVLPVGISFYIFQALSYTMDVYRKEVYAERNFLKYALFVSFFPQLVAGPIERSKNLLKQINVPHHFDFDRMKKGLLVMLWGYFQKLVIADRIAVAVDTVFGNVEEYQGMYFVVAAVLFAIQIYCDFSGYSTIAVGAAEIMGFRLMENFDCPYLAETVADFWRKWHISLTSWFRDYLYIPLGGNKRGILRKYINIMIVFLVSGLWHGAEWTFVLWGGLNGLYQVIGSILMPVRQKLKEVLHVKAESLGFRLLKVVITFILVDLAWIFFRADSVGDAFTILHSIFTVHNPGILLNGGLFELGLGRREFKCVLFSIAVLFLGDLLKKKRISVIGLIQEQDIWCRWTIYLAAVLFVMIFGVWGSAYDAQAFVYFQF